MILCAGVIIVGLRVAGTIAVGQDLLHAVRYTAPCVPAFSDTLPRRESSAVPASGEMGYCLIQRIVSVLCATAPISKVHLSSSSWNT